MKNRIPDQDGRYPLSEREYRALRKIFGLVTALLEAQPDLEARCRDIPGGWRDLRMLCAVSQGLMAKILRTVPKRKLGAIYQELDHTYTDVRVSYGKPQEGTQYTWIPAAALETIRRQAIAVECYCCDKQGKDAKRCLLRQALLDTYHDEVPPPTDGRGCPFAGTIPEDMP